MTRIPQFFSLFLGGLVFASLLLVWTGGDVLAKRKKVDINTAKEEELAKGQGISKELAKLIFKYRKKVGVKPKSQKRILSGGEPSGVMGPNCLTHRSLPLSQSAASRRVNFSIYTWSKEPKGVALGLKT
jgi:hypothetical protein